MAKRFAMWLAWFFGDPSFRWQAPRTRSLTKIPEDGALRIFLARPLPSGPNLAIRMNSDIFLEIAVRSRLADPWDHSASPARVKISANRFFARGGASKFRKASLMIASPTFTTITMPMP